LQDAECPLPPLPDIRHGPGPAYKELSYYDYDTDVIWLVHTDWLSREALYHELGHCFDRSHLTPGTRRRAARIIGHPGLRWFWGSWNPLRHYKQPNEENFADAYCECCMGGRPRLREFLKSITEGEW
jgi:hypothetical protein